MRECLIGLDAFNGQLENKLYLLIEHLRCLGWWTKCAYYCLVTHSKTDLNGCLDSCLKISLKSKISQQKPCQVKFMARVDLA